MTIAQTTKRKGKAHVASEILVGTVTALRPIAEADLPVLQGWDADPAIVALMGRQFGDVTVRDWFRSLRSGRAWAIQTLEGRLIGELELAQFDWRAGAAELRICIGEKDCWSHGYGTDAIHTALRVAFEAFDLQSVYLRVYQTNARAVRVYERIGFRKEALLEPCSRREDPAAILLMRLTRRRWHKRQEASAS